MPSTVVPGAVVEAGASDVPFWMGSFSGPIVPPPAWVGPVEAVEVVEVVPDGPGPYVIWKYQPHAAVQHYQPTIGSGSGHHTRQHGAHHRKRQHRNQR